MADTKAAGVTGEGGGVRGVNGVVTPQIWVVCLTYILEKKVVVDITILFGVVEADKTKNGRIFVVIFISIIIFFVNILVLAVIYIKTMVGKRAPMLMPYLASSSASAPLYRPWLKWQW